MALGMEVGPGPGHTVLHGNPVPLPKQGAESPIIFGPFLLCQTVGCIKIQLSMEVGLSPRDFVLDGDPAPPQKGA